jgi:hypothetical protein
LWAEQLRSAGLVTAKTSLAFHSWTIGTGPSVESNLELWDEIDSALEKGKVEAAAAALRRHLKYISRLLADQLGAAPQFRADGNYELGDLLPAVLARMKDLYSKVATAAQSWGKNDERKQYSSEKLLCPPLQAHRMSNSGAVNKAVYYDEWANFRKKNIPPQSMADGS